MRLSKGPSSDNALGSPGEMCFQLIERAGPASFVASARLLVMQQRMGQGEFGTLCNGFERDLDPRLARVFHAAFPAPAQDDALRPQNLEKLAAAFVLGAVEHPETHPIAAPDARIGFRHEHGPRVWPPPVCDTFGRGDRVKDYLRSCLDVPYEQI